ncbi:hypothetical protein P7C70_g7212, partial [Phenoliferia sp. Uapishka_3]
MRRALRPTAPLNASFSHSSLPQTGPPSAPGITAASSSTRTTSSRSPPKVKPTSSSPAKPIPHSPTSTYNLPPGITVDSPSLTPHMVLQGIYNSMDKEMSDSFGSTPIDERLAIFMQAMEKMSQDSELADPNNEAGVDFIEFDRSVFQQKQTRSAVTGFKNSKPGRLVKEFYSQEHGRMLYDFGPEVNKIAEVMKKHERLKVAMPELRQFDLVPEGEALERAKTAMRELGFGELAERAGALGPDGKGEGKIEWPGESTMAGVEADEQDWDEGAESDASVASTSRVQSDDSGFGTEGWKKRTEVTKKGKGRARSFKSKL